MTLDINGIEALGELLEIAEERLDDNLHFIDEDTAQRERTALDALWAHYRQLLDDLKTSES